MRRFFSQLLEFKTTTTFCTMVFTLLLGTVEFDSPDQIQPWFSQRCSGGQPRVAIFLACHTMPHQQNDRHIIICLVLALFTHHNYPPHSEEVGENSLRSRKRVSATASSLNFTPFTPFVLQVFFFFAILVPCTWAIVNHPSRLGWKK